MDKSNGKKGIKVRKNGISIYLTTDKFSDFKTLDNNKNISIQFSKETFGLCPGYYTAISNKGFPHPSKNNKLLALHWNINPYGAIKLMRSVTSGLNNLDMTFVIKAAINTKAFTFCNPVIVYLLRK